MRADRLLNIMLILQANGKTTTYKLAEALEVSRRTVLRDIDALGMAGVPVYCESGHGGGVYLDEKYQVSLTGLREDEIRSLFIANLAGPMKDLGFAQAAESGYLKLLAALPANHQTEVERVRQRIRIDGSMWWDTSRLVPFLSELMSAVFQNTRLKVTYKRQDTKVIERVLEPYSLVAKANVWYLIAANAGQFRTYRLSRLQAVELLGETFERSQDFDLNAFWADLLNDFRQYVPHVSCIVEIKAEKLEFLNWYFVEESTLLGEAGRPGWQKVELKFGSVEAAEMLVLALGQDARLLGPDYLIEMVLNKARGLVGIYGGQEL